MITDMEDIFSPAFNDFPFHNSLYVTGNIVDQFVKPSLSGPGAILF